MTTLTREWTTHSAEETIAAGAEIAALLKPPVLLVLRGGLGAGKTTLVKGIAQALGAAEADEVTSPTFTLVHEYEGSRNGAALALYHLDLYRLESERQLATVGWEEMLSEKAIVLVEWGEKFPVVAARADGEIALEGAGDERTIRLTFKG
jgi:tRNA threonylcarbamoyladenosine biosynthesis protein TsaE